MIGVVGVLLIAMIGMVQGDVDPGLGPQDDIRDIIRDGVTGNAIVFRKLVGGALKNDPPLTRSQVCADITVRHDSQNSGYLDGLTISSGDCVSALSSPQQYTQGRLNEWAGKHCGTSTAGGISTPDDADWEDISAQSPPVYTQDVIYDHRSEPPGGFNRVTDGNIYVEGFDPKDTVNYDGYQGSYVGYVIALPAMSGDPECMVKVTGTDAFIECLRTVTGVERRTSAGYFDNYAQYTIESPGSTCP